VIVAIGRIEVKANMEKCYQVVKKTLIVWREFIEDSIKKSKLTSGKRQYTDLKVN